GPLDLRVAQVAVHDMSHATAAQAVAAGEVAIGADQRLTGLVGSDASPRGKIGAYRLGNVGPEKDQTIVVLAVDQECPAVAVALQIGDVGAGDLHRAQRLQAKESEQRAIAQVLELLVVWDSAEQQRQLDLRQIAKVFGCAAIARGADADGWIVNTQAGGNGRGVHAP